MIRTALAYAKSQHEATRRAVDAWSCLRDGYVGSTLIPSTQVRRTPSNAARRAVDLFEQNEVEAKIFDNGGDGEDNQIVPVEHELFKQTPGRMDHDDGDFGGPETILPLVVASSIPEEGSDFGSSRPDDPFGLESSQFSHDFTPGMNAMNADDGEPETEIYPQHQEEESSPSTGNLHSSTTQFGGSSTKSRGDIIENEILTSSMQSLVNGLMNWGGQYDSEEDFALPTGMAASIALEESGVLSSHHNIA